MGGNKSRKKLSFCFLDRNHQIVVPSGSKKEVGNQQFAKKRAAQADRWKDL